MSEKSDLCGSDKLREAVENVEERLLDIQNLLQLLEVSLVDNQDDKHIVRSVNIICGFLDTLIEKDIVTLKEIIKVDKV